MTDAEFTGETCDDCAVPLNEQTNLELFLAAGSRLAEMVDELMGVMAGIARVEELVAELGRRTGIVPT